MIMSIIAALLAQAVAAQDAPGPLKIELLSHPTVEQVVECADRSHWEPRAIADLKARCLTAKDDRLDQCLIVTDTETRDRKVEEVALCVVAHWRVRALDADGKPVLGAPVGVPIRFGTNGLYHKAK